MQTITISDQAAKQLHDIAEQEHISSSDLIERLIEKHNKELVKRRERLADFAGTLANSPSFTGNLLDIQKAMRDEWD